LLDTVCDHILSINRANVEVQSGNFSSWQENRARQGAFELAENQRLQKDIKKLKAAARRSTEWAKTVEKSKYGATNSGSAIDRGYVGHKSAKMMQAAKNLERRQTAALEEKSKLLQNKETADDLKLSPLVYHAETLVHFRDVSVAYDENVVCEGVTFDIRRGDRIALLGKNGSGKSSLLKLICGAPIARTGEVAIGSQLKISCVPQNTSHLKGNLSDYAQRCGIDVALFLSILRKLDFQRSAFAQDISAFSGGQKKKVLIASSLCARAHLYLWDEPLNFIDVLSRIQIERLLEGSPITMLFVEHDSAFCDKIATKTVVL
jgi:lincosamide and streptogramin A transport system ATP-binding/permease protein